MTKTNETLQAETLICINCPRGCLLTVTFDPDQAPGRTDAPEAPGKNGIRVTGNACPRGIDYATQEVLHPVRVLTCLMRPEGADKPVSVRTAGAVPRDLLLDCARQIYRTHPPMPIRRGDVVIEDLCGTGVPVVATRDAG